MWAPGAAKIDDDHWMLYYTAQVAGTVGKMCTYRAHAAGPHGPFVDDFDGPMVCPDSTLWAIDPYPVRDAHGDWHLLARVDEPTASTRSRSASSASYLPEISDAFQGSKAS